MCTTIICIGSTALPFTLMETRGLASIIFENIFCEYLPRFKKFIFSFCKWFEFQKDAVHDYLHTS